MYVVECNENHYIKIKHFLWSSVDNIVLHVNFFSKSEIIRSNIWKFLNPKQY